MIKSKKFISFGLILPFLFSYAPQNVHSDVIGSEIKVRRKIGNTVTSKGYSTTSVSEEHLANINFTGELFYMEFDSELYTGETYQYSFIYRIDIGLNRQVKYKGGFLWLLTLVGSAKMRYLNLNGTFHGLKNPRNFVVTPSPYYWNYYGQTTNNPYVSSLYNRNNENGLKLIHGSRQTYDSFSYSSLSDGSGMLDALVYSYGTSSGSSDGYFQTRINYEDAHDNLGGGKSYYSGPKVGQGFYNFSIFGAVNFISETAPSSANIDIHMANSVSTDNLNDYNASFSDDSLGKSLYINTKF